MKTLDPSEWDFSRKGKELWTAERWEGCYYYEFMRQSPTIKNKVMQFRNSQSCGRPEKVKRNRCQSEEGCWRTLARLWPEWPDTPFQNIKNGIIKSRIQTRRKNPSQDDNRGVLQWDLNYIIGRHKDDVTIPECLEDFIDGKYDGELYNARETILTEEGRELICLEIDWSLGKTLILAAFKRWLTGYHPDKKPWLVRKRNSAPEGKGPAQYEKGDSAGTILGAIREERRGGWNRTKAFQSDLNYLGAWRIWKYYEENWPKISMFHQSHPVLGLQFQHKEAWYKARLRVKEILSSFNS